MRYMFGLLLLVATGCDLAGISDRVCTREYVPGIRITIADLDEQQLESAWAIAREGSYIDSTRFLYGTATLAYERAGRYTVEVVHPDYEPWQRFGVKVGEDECHVQTVEFSIDLGEHRRGGG